MNIADMMIDTYVVESTLLRVEKLADVVDKKFDQTVYDAILKTSFTDAADRIQKNAKDALASFTEGELLQTMLKGVQRFGQYAPTNVKKARRLVAEQLIAAEEYCF